MAALAADIAFEEPFVAAERRDKKALCCLIRDDI
jgi:hypothetical protein